MQTHTFPNIPELGPLAVTTGFFDGIHSGHTAVISQMIQVARQSELPACVVTYHPHPRVVLGKNEGLQLLTCFEEKQQRLASLGVDHLIVIPFTKALAELSAETFFEEYLVKSLNTKKLIIGYDHNIGKNASAGYEAIKNLGDMHGVETMQVQAHMQNDVEISSTKIRSALMDGDIATANNMLGYNYMIYASVVSGKRIGRALGFPTANLKPKCELKMLPKSGVYVVQVDVAGKQYGGMLNIGTRPTVSNNEERSTEVHIFNFSADIYDSNITVSFVERLRDERKMSSPEELKSQLLLDELKAKLLLTRLELM